MDYLSSHTYDKERHFQVLFDLSPDPAWIIDNHHFVECNQAALDFLGYAHKSELTNLHPAELSPEFQPDGESSFSKAESIMELARKHGMHRFEWVHLRADGSSFLAEVTLSLIHLNGNEVFYCVWRDITGAKRVERQAQTYLETTHTIMVALDPEGCITMINPAGCKLLGYMQHELLGRNWFETCLPQPEGKELVLPYFRQLMSGTAEPVMSFENAILCHDGSLRNCSWHNTYYSDEVTGSIKGILSSGEDVTERKRTETDLRIAAAAFESQAAMIVTDAKSVILKVNQAFTKLTGYDAEEVVGKTPNILKSDRHHDDFYRDMWQTIRKTGHWQGEIWDRRKNGEVYPKWLTISSVGDAQGVITHYIGAQYDITERKAAEDRIKALAYYDQLTGLANRFSLTEQLDQMVRLAARSEEPFVLMLLDLDNFKAINDSLGHHVGDELLVLVAKRLQAVVRHSDIVGRFGGDEFVILLPDMDSPTDAATLADKIVTTLSEPYRTADHELRTSPSIGICLYPNDATDSLDLMQKADAAMYQAKSRGRSQYQFFEQAYQEAAIRRLTLEADLRTAIKQQQFVLYYQPQFDFRSGALYGVEALIRWQHPEHGLVPPLEFISIAEETGLILPIGNWVIEEACRQLATWQSQGLTPLTVSINMTASQFLDPQLPARIMALLDKHGVKPGSLGLEVTESMSMDQPEQTITTMRELRNCGLTLSIDDFGTGYSSLAYLKNFPINTLKIDRSFVMDIETDQSDADICDVTVLLAHKLGMDVVAEGVETKEQLNYLRSIGCEKVQGYLISKPLPAAAVFEFIRSNPVVTNLGSIVLWEHGGE